MSDSKLSLTHDRAVASISLPLSLLMPCRLWHRGDLQRFEGQSGVETPKAKGIGKGNFDPRIPGVVRDVVEITGWIRMLVVDRGGKNAMIQGQDGKDGLDASSGP